jgi:hypothetical protein
MRVREVDERRRRHGASGRPVASRLPLYTPLLSSPHPESLNPVPCERETGTSWQPSSGIPKEHTIVVRSTSVDLKSTPASPHPPITAQADNYRRKSSKKWQGHFRPCLVGFRLDLPLLLTSLRLNANLPTMKLLFGLHTAVCLRIGSRRQQRYAFESGS